MLLRMSSLFLRTLREDPAEAEVPSHRLLVRAGYIRRAAPGGYTWLPLGKLVLDRVAEVVREEMAAIGGQEVLFPALLPREPYERSGRWLEYGPDMFRLRDRRGVEHLLAPTHEEMFTLLVKDLFSSYRDFPLVLFQVQTKFRDEPRPRAGLLRGREFLMKDSYSFDLDDAGLAASYERHRRAYQRIFDRLGLSYTIVAAMPGAMGGTRSEEFLAASPIGEDSYVACDACDYAANTEAVTTPAPPAGDPAAAGPLQVHDTPDTPTIESLVELANARRLAGRADWTAAATLKNVVVRLTQPDGAEEILVIGVPGDREVDMKRLAAAVYPATVSMFEDFAAHPDLVRGYIGPQVLRKLGVRYLVDPRVVPGTAWLTGANEPGRHATNVVCGRDFTPDGTVEAAEVRAGDPCPACQEGALAIRRGIEIGHVFQLGRRFADAFGLDALGPDGRPVRITMGSYGIGISRVVAAIAEQHHDERGLAWPAGAAPLDVHLVPAGAGPQLAAALDLAGELAGRGLRVLVDDRTNVSAGVKFADAELIGIPRAVVVGRRLAEGYVELRERASGERRDVPVGELVSRLVQAQV
ncbi:MAG: proline--tRNA ligase [Micromonosporaceae bacterium]|jgi:prolyl-tRNA synthetase|nr:proline--tRNA ligase [Micromonosporaceae bacterium]